MRLIGLVVPTSIEPALVDVDEPAEQLGIGAVPEVPDVVTYPCTQCERSFGSSNAVRIHAGRAHARKEPARPAPRPVPVPAPAAAVVGFPQPGPIERRPVDAQAVRDAQADAF